MNTPKNLDELATLIGCAIKSENKIGPGHDEAIRKIAVAVARHGSRYTHHVQLTSHTGPLRNASARGIRGVIQHRATTELAEFGILLAPILKAMMSFAVRWFLEWLLKRLENRDAVAAIASRETAWVSTEEPTEIDQ